MYKLVLTGTPFEMGKITGDFFKMQQTRFPIRLNKFQKEHGRESAKLLHQFFPEACQEIRGISDSIGVDYETFASWMMCMGCCLILRENHNVEVRGCTAFCFVKRNKIFYGRNNDLPPYLKNVSKSIFYAPVNKNKFILNTSSFVNGEEGINEHGLTAAMTFVIPHLDEIKPGLNSVFLVRYLLENCANVDEGISALYKLPIASSCNILLADRSKKMVVAECNPDKINLRQPEANTNSESFIVTVNHFTSKEMIKHDRSNQNVYSSRIRYQTAYNALKNINYEDALVFAKELLSGKYGFMCQYKKIKFDTIWSSIFNVTENKICLAEGNPHTTEFFEDLRLFKR